MSAVLVLIGALLLWPLFARRHGRGIAIATEIALVFGTVAYAIARGPWPGGAAFAGGAVVVCVAASRVRTPAAPARIWSVAAVVSLIVLVVRRAGPDAVLDGLFSSWGGLLYGSPILWLGIAGCLRDGRHGPAGVLAPSLLIAVALGAATTDAAADHGARFAPVLPLLGLGLARAFDGMRRFVVRRPLAPIAAGIAVLAAWNALLMAQYRDGRIPRDDTVSFPRVTRNAAATVSARVGSPPAWPANWIFAVRNAVSPDRYDLLGGVDLLAPGTLGLGGTIDVGNARTDEAVLREGWSVRHPCGGEVCRAVEGAASLVVPIGDPRDSDVTVFAAGGGMLTMHLNGIPVLQGAVTADLRPITARVARGRFRRGVNTIAFAARDGEPLVDRIVFAEAAR